MLAWQQCSDPCRTNLLRQQTPGVLLHSAPFDGPPSCTLWLHCSCEGDQHGKYDGYRSLKNKSKQLSWYNRFMASLQKEVETPRCSSTPNIGRHSLVESSYSLLLPHTLHTVHYATVLRSQIQAITHYIERTKKTFVKKKTDLNSTQDQNNL